MTNTGLTIPDKPYEALTESEYDILRLIVKGYKNAQISKLSFVALSTVKWHIRQIYNKLGVNSRDEAIAFALQAGLVDSGSDAEPIPHNLPSSTTPIVGRVEELSCLTQLLTQPDTRLVTILAPGGMGKTALAIEVARRGLHHFSDGVYFVPLRPLNNPSDIALQIGASMGMQFTSGERETTRALVDGLRDKRILLILDNYEHLMDGVMLVNDILVDTTATRLLVTSRQRLNLIGETVFALDSLSLPEVGSDNATAYDAITLFSQTARRAKPDWTLDDKNLADVITVCQLVGGMPLGILLAGSWVAVYRVDQIVRAIQQSTDFLTTEMADVPPRQRSVRAVFEAAWERLKPTERGLFMKMSVFRGGFELEAAEAITGADPRTLKDLFDKALLTRDISGRYDVHELLRQYAERLLDATDEADALRHQHAAYYSRFVAARDVEHGTFTELEIAESIDADFDNIRTAWHWLVAQANYDALSVMVFPLLHFFWTRQYRVPVLLSLFETVHQTIEARELPSHARSLYGRALVATSVLHFNFYRRRKEGHQQAEQALEVLSTTDDELGVTFAQARLAYMYINQSEDLEVAQALLDAVEAGAHRIGNRRLSLTTLLERGRLRQRQGLPLSDFRAYLDQAIRVANEAGYRFLENNLWLFLSITLVAMGDPQGAMTALSQAREIEEADGFADFTDYFIGNLNAILGKADEARRYYWKMIAYGRRMVEYYWAADGYLSLADLESITGQHDVALTLLDECAAMEPSITKKWYFIWRQGKVAYRRGDYAVALRYFESVYDNAANSNPVEILPDMALLLLRVRRDEDAVALLRQSLQHAIHTERRLYYAQHLCGIAKYYVAHDDAGRAAEIARLVYDHPVTPYEFRLYARQLLGVEPPEIALSTNPTHEDRSALDTTTRMILALFNADCEAMN